jgi:hypothetical protein
MKKCHACDVDGPCALHSRGELEPEHCGCVVCCNCGAERGATWPCDGPRASLALEVGDETRTAPDTSEDSDARSGQLGAVTT